MTRKQIVTKRAELEAALAESKALHARAVRAVDEATISIIRLEAQLALLQELTDVR